MTIGSDVVVIGGGIAGVSAGALLAERGLSVRLVEAEATLAHHTTGRSAAVYLENYGPDAIRRLTIAGRSWLEDPPGADRPFWSTRPFLRVANADQVEQLATTTAAAQELVPSTRFLEPAEALQLCPALRPDLVAGAMLEPDTKDIDVDALHQLFVRGIRRAAGSIHTNAPVVGLERTSDATWRVDTPDETFTTNVVVNAAGAWCDRIAQLAGVETVGLHPLRRTVAIASVPDRFDPRAWPFVSFETGDGAMAGYFRPEAGGLLVSPADETPSEPCDAQPEELDVAMALEVVNQWTTLELRHVRSTWAGLRSFVTDRNPVCGFAPDAPGFFWLAGQGGYGIHSSAGLAQATAGLICDGRLPDHLIDLGLDEAELAPDRPGLGPPPIGGH